MTTIKNKINSFYLPVLSTVVLFCLSFIALTRFHDGILFTGFEIVVNAITFFMVLIFGVVALRIFSLQERIRSVVLWASFLIVIMCTIAAPLFGNTLGLGGVQQIGYHDGAAQTDVAYELLIKGNNPYSVDFSQTRFGEQYGRLRISDEGKTIPNPALTQYVYFPGTLIQGGLSSLQSIAIGKTDARPLMLVSMLIAAFLLLRMIHNLRVELKIIVASLFLLNPVYLRYLLEGANDSFLLLLLVLSLFLLEKKYIRSAGIVLGIALATKHFAWFLLPFLAVYLLYRWKQGQSRVSENKQFALYTLVVCMLFMLPFLFWSPSDFIQDTILYAVGSGSESIFPITGYGISQLVTLFGVSMESNFPFIVLTLPITLLLIWFGVRFVGRNISLSSVIAATTFTLFGYMLFSRMMNENYMGLLVGLCIVAGVFSLHEQSQLSPQEKQSAESKQL